MSINVAVIGAGYWGPNLIRNFVACPLTRLVAVYDQVPDKAAKALVNYPQVEAGSDFKLLLERDDIDAVAIATPVDTHAPLATAALEAGKHVLLEKPMTSTVADAQALIALAKKQDRVLMVDHTFIYNESVRTMKRIIDSGELGDIYFVDSVRINLGLIQRDVNVVWDLAPHDLSILDYLIGRDPKSISAFGRSHVPHSSIEDVAYLTLDLGDNLIASFHVNWLSPVKVRHFIIGGKEKSIVFNDLNPDEKIRVYSRGIALNEDPQTKHRIMVDYRTGDVWSPHVALSEPLGKMVKEFAQSIIENRAPLTDGHAGLRIVRLLEAAQKSIQLQGTRIALEPEAPSD
jgi:predicted dehydrogenase